MVWSQIRKYGWEKILKLIIVWRTIIWTPRVQNLGHGHIALLTHVESSLTGSLPYQVLRWLDYNS